VTGPQAVSSADSDTTGQHATAASLSGTAGAVGDIGGGLGAESRLATKGQNRVQGQMNNAERQNQPAKRAPKKKKVSEEERAKKRRDALQNERHRCGGI
jgi:hypothetical protein